jgi:hypothetical protein
MRYRKTSRCTPNIPSSSVKKSDHLDDVFRNFANWACTLSSAFASEATAAACSFEAVFAAAAPPEKTSFSSGERRRNSFRKKLPSKNAFSSRKSDFFETKTTLEIRDFSIPSLVRQEPGNSFR